MTQLSRTYDLRAGPLVMLSGSEPHAVKAITETLLLVTVLLPLLPLQKAAHDHRKQIAGVATSFSFASSSLDLHYSYSPGRGLDSLDEE